SPAAPPGGVTRGHALGALAVLLAAGPPVLAVAMLDRDRLLAPLLAVAVLYFVIGHRSLHEHAIAVKDALRRGDLPDARRRVGAMVSRDTSDMDAHRVAAATVESLLENGNDALFGALFWFLLTGPPGHWPTGSSIPWMRCGVIGPIAIVGSGGRRHASMT
ncbi:Cobalamin (vitamin B12) biosynthesis CbiB, partial [mine drainage metagenome]